MPTEEHRVTWRELLARPRGFDTVENVLYGSPIIFGRGIERPGLGDRWEAWRDPDDVMVIRITRAEPDPDGSER